MAGTEPTRRIYRSLFVATMAVMLQGCLSIPEGITPVEGFDLERYQGRWYEIARLDHSFERGLERVTAEYTLLDDSRVQVVNRGYSPATETWKEAVGKAGFAGDSTIGHLRVSFFGPFYSSYIVFHLDPDYRYAFVSGPTKSYLWLLARTPEVQDDLVGLFIRYSRERGFPTDDLIYLRQASSELPGTTRETD